MDIPCDTAMMAEVKVPAMVGLNLFLICPVRNVNPQMKSFIENWVMDTEHLGNRVYYPARDTDQNDPIGYEICQHNRAAIQMADMVCVIWDGKSQGSLFDLGMAFMLNKPLCVVGLPFASDGKSFQNMMLEWEKQQNSFRTRYTE